MAFESVRSYVQLASGLGEMTKARALEAAQGLLALPGADEVTRRAVQASTLADQLLEAAKANRDNLVALVQSEVEAALKRADVARLADVEAARTSLAALTKELADLRSTVLAAGVSAVSSASRSPLASRGRAATGAVSTRAGQAAHEAADLPGASTVTDGARAAVDTLERPAAATKSTAARTAAKKSTAKKSTAKKPTAKKTAPRKSAAKKSAAKKSASPSGSPSATRKSATRKSAAKKSTARKSTASTSTSSTSASPSTATKAGS